MTQQESSDNTLRLDKLNKLEEGIQNLQITNETLAKENANRAGEIKELAHKLNIQIYSASLMTNDSAPIMRSRRVASDYQSEGKEEEEEIQEERVIYRTARDSSPFNATLWVVPEKADTSGKRKWRIIIDFCKLNEQTDQDAYPLPNIDDILDHLDKILFRVRFIR